MIYLLDTQVLVWLSTDSKKIGKKARIILKRALTLYFSAVSIAELEVKSANGKYQLEKHFISQLVDAGLTELAFTSNHARSVSRFPELNKHDPADRMILAQATAEQIPLLTSDSKLLNLDFNWIIDAQE